MARNRLATIASDIAQARREIHYADKHDSVLPGGRIDRCTDEPCPRMLAAETSFVDLPEPGVSTILRRMVDPLTVARTNARILDEQMQGDPHVIGQLRGALTRVNELLNQARLQAAKDEPRG